MFSIDADCWCCTVQRCSRTSTRRSIWLATVWFFRSTSRRCSTSRWRPRKPTSRWHCWVTSAALSGCCWAPRCWLCTKCSSSRWSSVITSLRDKRVPLTVTSNAWQTDQKFWNDPKLQSKVMIRLMNKAINRRIFEIINRLPKELLWDYRYTTGCNFIFSQASDPRTGRLSK